MEYINWKINSDEILKLSNRILNKSKETNNTIANFIFKKNMDDEYDNFLSILSNDIIQIDNLHSLCVFLSLISTDAKMKSVCNELNNVLTLYKQNLNHRDDIYISIRKFKSVYCDKLTNEDKNFIDNILITYEKNGINLPQDKCKEIKLVKEKILSLENKIKNTIIQFDKYIGLDPEDLDGIPMYIIEKLPILSNKPLKYGILMNNEMYTICMTYINSHLIRKRIEHFYNTRCMENVMKLSLLFYYRNRYAKLLSFNNYTDLCVNKYVAQNHLTIKNFITSIINKTHDRYIKEIKMLLKIKKKHCISQKISFDNKLNSWDILYYTNLWKQDYELHKNNLDKYFPKGTTVSKIIHVFENLFDIKIVKKNEILWSDNVELYEVSRNENLIGCFYLDLYKRKNKCNVTKCFNLQFPCKLSNEKYQIPITVFMANFSNITSYFTHKEIAVIFHEFGHIFHQILGQATYNIFSGTNVEYDFVEVFGLLYEKFCWNEYTLKQIINNPKNISGNDINKLIKTRNLTIAIDTRKKLLYSYYDQLVHCSEKFINVCNQFLETSIDKNTKINVHNMMLDVYEQLYNEIMLTKDDNGNEFGITFNKNTFMPASWIHLTERSSAMYYSELWSEIYATDIYCSVFQNNQNMQHQNKKIVNKIMMYDSKRTPFIKLKKFLKRQMNYTNFLTYYDLVPNDEVYSFFYDTESENISDDDKIFNTYNDIQDNKYNNEHSDIYTENAITNNFSEYCESNMQDDATIRSVSEV